MLVSSTLPARRACCLALDAVLRRLSRQLRPARPRRRVAQTARRTSRSPGAVDEERRRIPGTVHRFPRRHEFRRRRRRGGGRGRHGPRARPRYEYTPEAAEPSKADRLRSVATRIPRRIAICPASRARSISPAGSIRCRSSRTRNPWRCCTKRCTTSASSRRTTARIRGTTGRGTATRAAAGKATRWSWT